MNRLHGLLLPTPKSIYRYNLQAPEVSDKKGLAIGSVPPDRLQLRF